MHPGPVMKKRLGSTGLHTKDDNLNMHLLVLKSKAFKDNKIHLPNYFHQQLEID